MRGSASRGAIASPDRVVVTTLSTPGGRPASARISVIANDDSGVNAAGLSTMVQPAASAGPTLRVAIAIGKFQGVISTHGPTGWRVTRIRP